MKLRRANQKHRGLDEMPKVARLLLSVLGVGCLLGLRENVSLAPSTPPFYLSAKVKTMAQGIFIGLTEEQLLSIRDKAVSLITEGKTLMSYSDSGSSASKQWAMPPKEMLAEAQYALYLFDPQQYSANVRSTVIRTNWNNQYRQ